MSDTLRAAIPAEAELDRARARSHSYYRTLGELLVELRHEFPGPNGETHDLRGRSAAYRATVRVAYRGAGVTATEPIPKRLTAGVAYWVRKLLLERYGRQTLFELGVLRGPTAAAPRPRSERLNELPEDPASCLAAVVEVLNSLAVDPHLVPSEAAVRAAARAVLLLRDKLERTPHLTSQPAGPMPPEEDTAELGQRRPVKHGGRSRPLQAHALAGHIETKG